MTIEKINGNTWRIEDGFVRCFLLEGSEKAVLIDTGATCADARALAESVTDKPVVLVNTHGDGDHVAGNAAFDSFYMHEADYINCNVAARCPDSRLIPLNDGDIIDAEYDFDGETVILGDIIISTERALEQAEEFGHTFVREVAFLCVHSMLHLLGYDHVDDPEGEAIMREKQTRILNELGIRR